MKKKRKSKQKPTGAVELCTHSLDDLVTETEFRSLWKFLGVRGQRPPDFDKMALTHRGVMQIADQAFGLPPGTAVGKFLKARVASDHYFARLLASIEKVCREAEEQ